MMLASEITKFAAGHGWEMRVMGIPKTVDNDIVLTDHCPGYGSAARYLAVTALDPPWFGPDGTAIHPPGRSPAPGRPTDSEHIRS